ncbi:6-phosphogluconolactonase [Marinobacter lacisalsi]|uniref:6-phosphogluconolactonase n=1 Tax=Marinobacter lacisalsi TaxID=475979 RepID=A0ABV8QGL4_9GAMM
MKTPEHTLLPGVAFCAWNDSETLARDLAGQVADRLRQSIETRGGALMVVSGGQTPVDFFRVLSGQALPWEKVTILPSDERWVPADSDQRNSRLIRRNLLQGAAASSRLIDLVETDDQSPEQSAERASDRLYPLHWPADVVVLGMGEDGHTASLFPDAPELAFALSADAPSVVVTTPPSQSTVRLTLSARVLSGAALTALLIRGEGKRVALEEAVSAPLAIGPMPVRYFFQQPLRVVWSP